MIYQQKLSKRIDFKFRSSLYLIDRWLFNSNLLIKLSNEFY